MSFCVAADRYPVSNRLTAAAASAIILRLPRNPSHNVSYSVEDFEPDDRYVGAFVDKVHIPKRERESFRLDDCPIYIDFVASPRPTRDSPVGWCSLLNQVTVRGLLSYRYAMAIVEMGRRDFTFYCSAEAE